MKNLAEVPHLMRAGQETSDRYRPIMWFSEAVFNIEGVFSFPATPRPHFQRSPPPSVTMVRFCEQEIQQRQQEACMDEQGAPD